MIGSVRRGDACRVVRRVVLRDLLRVSLVLAVAHGGVGCRREMRTVDQPGGAAPVTTSVKLDNFGYRPDDTKVAIFSADPGATVQVRTASGAVVFSIPTNGGSISSKGKDASSGDQVWW